MENKTTSKYAVFAQRLSEAWNYKAPILISVPYYFALIGSMKPEAVIFAIAASYLTISGIAGFGYFINDLTDARQDALAGKANGIAGLNPLQKVVILLIILLLALLPWMYLPLERTNAPFLLLQFVLFIIYSIPPFRLKERGLAGVLTDALYAHINPSLLAALTFISITGKPVWELRYYLLFLILWQLFLGIRNIVQHQITDKANDNQAQVQTFVAQTTFHDHKKMITHLLMPLELLSFSLFFGFIGLHGLGWAGVGFCITMLLLQFITFKNSPEFQAGGRKEILLLANQMYLVWLPLSILLTICTTRPKFVLLLLPHILLFKEVQTRLGALFRQWWQILYYEIRLPKYTLSQIMWEIQRRMKDK
ncbi:hypothetical protein C7N43_27010 [Sphingobacteriales bacterium UPWRP_1]|nr:hypothetical protein B6N25_16445 [Sphingobacteriales bacterium TSM_CSS]PSJ73867.1 hypothetical protein C7N43_27010 [Sphingobacteriales bacterium UPWRP_1]